MVDVNQEIARHLQWKENIIWLLQHESDAFLPPQIIYDHEHCSLGKWLRTEEAKICLEPQQLLKLSELHGRFHAMAGTIVTLAEQKKLTDVENLENRLTALSTEIIELLDSIQSN